MSSHLGVPTGPSGDLAREAVPPGRALQPASVPRALPTDVARPARWVEKEVALAAVGIIGYGLASLIPTATRYRWPLVALTLVGMTVVGYLGWRINRRRRILAAAANTMTAQLKTPIVVTRARWQGHPVGTVVAVHLRYPDNVALAYNDLFPSQVVAAAGRAFGRPFRLVKHTPARRTVKLAVQPERPDRPLDDLELQKRRVSNVVGETFGAEATVRDVHLDDDRELIDRFTVQYRGIGPRLTVASVRRRISNGVTDRLDGKWRATFHLADDEVTFQRRPPLPTYIPRPATPVPDVDDPAFNLIPQAVSEDGSILCWDIGGPFAHVLKCGRTRTGKTVSLIGDAVEAARRGFRVFVLDPKRIEFLGMRDWPNVVLVATRVPEQVALVSWFEREMNERYRRIEEEGASEQDFERILFIIDEYRQFYANARAWWMSIKVSGMPTECPVFESVGALLRMAAAARIHISLGTQRPDAEFLTGETRDNFSARAATGRLSPDGAKMMYDNPHVGVSVPLNVRGRGTMIGLDDQPQEVQFLYTPDPRKATSAEDIALLDALRPDTTRWPRQMIRLSDLEAVAADIPDGKKTSLEWEQVLRAELVDFDPATAAADLPDPDPAADRSDPDPYSGYSPAGPVRAASIVTGDLISLDQAGGWVCVSDVVRSGGEVQIEWRDDDDTVGDLVLDRDEALQVRCPSRD